MSMPVQYRTGVINLPVLPRNLVYSLHVLFNLLVMYFTGNESKEFLLLPPCHSRYYLEHFFQLRFPKCSILQRVVQMSVLLPSLLQTFFNFKRTPYVGFLLLCTILTREGGEGREGWHGTADSCHPSTRLQRRVWRWVEVGGRWGAAEGPWNRL